MADAKNKYKISVYPENTHFCAFPFDCNFPVLNSDFSRYSITWSCPKIPIVSQSVSLWWSAEISTEIPQILRVYLNFYWILRVYWNLLNLGGLLKFWTLRGLLKLWILKQSWIFNCEYREIARSPSPGIEEHTDKLTLGLAIENN